MSKTLVNALMHMKIINPDTEHEKGFNVGVNSAIQVVQSLPHESKEIPMSEILDIPRQIAVAFADTYIDMRDMVKLASDIQNFAIQYAESKEQWISVQTEPPEKVWYQCAMLKSDGDYDVLLMAYQFYKFSGWIAYGEPFQDERITHYRKLPSPPTK